MQAAALAGARWLGRGDKHAADQAAVDQMRKVLNSIAMDGVVVIGEGEKDEVHQSELALAHCCSVATAYPSTFNLPQLSTSC